MSYSIYKTAGCAICSKYGDNKEYDINQVKACNYCSRFYCLAHFKTHGIFTDKMIHYIEILFSPLIIFLSYTRGGI